MFTQQELELLKKHGYKKELLCDKYSRHSLEVGSIEIHKDKSNYIATHRPVNDLQAKQYSATELETLLGYIRWHILKDIEQI